MRILFIYSESDPKHHFGLQFLIDAIKKAYPGAVFINTETTDRLPPHVLKQAIDAVLLFNVQAYTFFEKHIQASHCVIFIAGLSPVYALHELDVSKIDQFIVLNQNGMTGEELKLPNEPSFVIAPIPLKKKTATEKTTSQQRTGVLLVNDDANGLYDPVFLAQIRVANSIINKYRNKVPVTFLSARPVPASMIDANISVKTAATQRALQAAFSRECKKHDVLVGYGLYALQACCNDTHVIVAGKKGYGGRVTADNLHTQFRFHFDGRAGRTINEFIPDLFVAEEIYELIREPVAARIKDIQAVAQKLFALREETRERLECFIEKAVSNKRLIEQDFTNRKFTLSKEYKLVDLSTTCLLINNYTLKSEFECGVQEHALLQRFRNTVSIKELLNSFPDKKDQTYIRDFIYDSYKNKILICKD